MMDSRNISQSFGRPAFGASSPNQNASEVKGQDSPIQEVKEQIDHTSIYSIATSITYDGQI